MRRVRFTRHAEERIRSRGIELEAVMEVLEKPDYRFFDVEEDTIIYASKRNRLIVVAVPEGSEELRVVTVVPCSRIDGLVERRLRSGRWISLEPP